jgi:hypothetical protein
MKSFARKVWDLLWSRPDNVRDAALATLTAFAVLWIGIWALNTILFALTLPSGYPQSPRAPITGYFVFDVLIGLRLLPAMLWLVYSKRVAFLLSLLGLVVALTLLWPALPDSIFGTTLAGTTTRIFIPMIFVLWLLNRALDAFDDWRRKKSTP